MSIVNLRFGVEVRSDDEWISAGDAFSSWYPSIESAMIDIEKVGERGCDYRIVSHALEYTGWRPVEEP